MKTKFTVAIFVLLFPIMSYGQITKVYNISIVYTNIEYTLTGYMDLLDWNNQVGRYMEGNMKFTPSNQINNNVNTLGLVKASFDVDFHIPGEPNSPSLSFTLDDSTPSGIVARTEWLGVKFLVEYTKSSNGYKIKPYFSYQ